MGKDSLSDAGELPMGNDLDQLRTILFGNQSRAIEKRLNDLELHLETVRREMTQHFDERITTLAESSAEDLAQAEAEQTRQNKDLQERLDKLAADFNKQLQAVQKELAQQIDKQGADLQRKLLEFQSEARQRDDDLRVELLALGAMLDNQKTGRDELAQMLIQLGGQLQGNVKKTAVSAANSKKPKS
jgi:tetrahydromethanopterin S-methyltransferase subunit G